MSSYLRNFLGERNKYLHLFCPSVNPDLEVFNSRGDAIFSFLTFIYMPAQGLNPLKRMLAANAQWAEDVARAEPSFFEDSAKGQSPHVSIFIDPWPASATIC